MRNVFRVIAAVALLHGSNAELLAQEAAVRHVVHISVDGVHPGAVTALGPQRAPNFYRLRSEGAFTDNARTDPDIAATLPGHASQLTARHARGAEGHGLLWNADTGETFTLHDFSDTYVSSVFDVVHDAGHATALYASKEKFAFFDRSWNELYGAPDRNGVDNGRDKIDTFYSDPSMEAVVERFVEDMGRSHYNYVVLHLREPDSTGHESSWDLSLGSDYLNAVMRVDEALGKILELIETNPQLAHATAIVLTSDHSGMLGSDSHFLLPPFLNESGVVPFYVWTPGGLLGMDLYELNSSRLEPGTSVPPATDPIQPIRNGDAANLALDLLGLPPIPGSTINADQDLLVGQ